MTCDPEIPGKTLYEVLRDTAAGNPGSPAYSFAGIRDAYAVLYKSAGRIRF